MTKRTIRIVKDSAELATAAADAIVCAATAAITARGRFTIALSGGSTPEKAYELLALPERSRRVEWPRVQIFWGDERFVPHDDPCSNYALAVRTLLQHVPIPQVNIHSVPTDVSDARAAAIAYSVMVAEYFALDPSGPPPRIDLILLGLGDDGHTASLFPGKPSLDEHNAWFTGSPAGVLPPPVDRITATFPLLNGGRQVIFLVGGEKKKAIVRQVLTDVDGKYPSTRVAPEHGELLWLLDAPAAALLPPGV